MLQTLITNYYRDIKELLSLIVNNKKTLLPIINQVIKEHLEYDEYNRYYKNVQENLEMISELVAEKKKIIPDSPEDDYTNSINEELYNDRIAPFLVNYVTDEYEEPNKGSIILTAIVTIVLFVTIAVILLAIYAVSKMDM